MFMFKLLQHDFKPHFAFYSNEALVYEQISEAVGWSIARYGMPTKLGARRDRTRVNLGPGQWWIGHYGGGGGRHDVHEHHNFEMDPSNFALVHRVIVFENADAAVDFRMRWS